MTDSLTIHLGAREFTVQPLTIGQLRDLHVGAAQSMAEGIADVWDRNIRIIVTALKEDHPDVTSDVIMKLRGVTFDEITAAVRAIFNFSGLVKQENESGEAKAEAA